MMTIGCVTTVKATLSNPWHHAETRPVQVNWPAPVYTFTVTTWHETTFTGIPFFIECQKQKTDQWFNLKAKVNGQYLPLVGRGFLQAKNIVWISWPDEFKSKAKQNTTFELWTDGPDQIGVQEVSLIADQMFSWQGDVPINPPEE
ncbi:MAG: hypothetical protein WCX08_04745 [Candidatus Buchananbacteria bacterium]